MGQETGTRQHHCQRLHRREQALSDVSAAHKDRQRSGGGQLPRRSSHQQLHLLPSRCGRCGARAHHRHHHGERGEPAHKLLQREHLRPPHRQIPALSDPGARQDGKLRLGRCRERNRDTLRLHASDEHPPQLHAAGEHRHHRLCPPPRCLHARPHRRLSRLQTDGAQ